MTRNEIINNVINFGGVATYNSDPFAIEDATDSVVAEIENADELICHEPATTDTNDWSVMCAQLDLGEASAVSRIYEIREAGASCMMFAIASDYAF